MLERLPHTTSREIRHQDYKSASCPATKEQISRLTDKHKPVFSIGLRYTARIANLRVLRANGQWLSLWN